MSPCQRRAWLWGPRVWWLEVLWWVLPAAWRPGRLWADLCCDADALEYVSGDSHRRSKRPGVPLRIRLAGQLARRAAAPVAVEVDALALDLGGSHVRLAGRAQVALDAEGRPPAADLSHPRGWAAAGLRQFEAKLTGLIAFDPALAALFPEVGDLGRRHGLDGSAEVDANIRADENEATLWGHIDADRLAFRLAEGVSKPVGLPARAALAARAPADLSRFHVSNLQLRAGDVHLLAGGSLQLRSPTDRGWDVDLVDLHLAAWTRRADTLVRLAEGLGPYRLKGDAIIEAEWTNHHGGYLRYVSVGAESLRGYYRGKTAVVSSWATCAEIPKAAGRSADYAPTGWNCKLARTTCGSSPTCRNWPIRSRVTSTCWRSTSTRGT